MARGWHVRNPSIPLFFLPKSTPVACTLDPAIPRHVGLRAAQAAKLTGLLDSGLFLLPALAFYTPYVTVTSHNLFSTCTYETWLGQISGSALFVPFAGVSVMSTASIMPRRPPSLESVGSVGSPIDPKLRKKVAVVGSGCAGIAALWALNRSYHDVYMYEAASRLGGHTNTVTWKNGKYETRVDTGFIVLNAATYREFAILAR